MTTRSIFIFVFLLLTSIQSQVVQESATLSQIVGSVEVRSGESAKWRKARIGMPVKTNWDIRTFLESSAEVTLESGTILKINENTMITLAKMNRDKKTNATQSNVKILSGQMWANVKKMTNSNSKFDFETPTAVASIRGTRLGIGVGKEKTSIDVFEGLVMVRKINSSQSIAVKPNFRVNIESNSNEIQLLEFKDIPKDDTLKSTTTPYDPFASIKDLNSMDTLNVEGQAPSQTTESINTNGYTLQIISPLSGEVVRETPVILRGKTSPGAALRIDDKTIEIGSDGSFAELVDLKPGANIVSVISVLSGIQSSQEVKIEYHPPLELSVGNIENDMEVTSRNLLLDISVSENATFSTNGKVGETSVTLTEGRNTIVVEAWDEWNTRTVQQFQVTYTTVNKFNLTIVSPANGVVLKEPFIQVTGSTVARANVYINDRLVSVGRDGFFSSKLPIPDEPQEYDIEIRAEFDGEELVEERSVVYQPDEEKLTLFIASPQNGQVIDRTTIRLTGKTTPGSQVVVNDIRASVLDNGTFAITIPVTEKDIGDYVVDVTCSNQGNELTKTLGLLISGTSNLINTSIPQCIVQFTSMQATSMNTLSIQTLDRTPNDLLTIDFKNNGTSEEIATESGKKERITFQEGKNNYSIVVKDMAGNLSNNVNGMLYYLPGPLSLSVIEPSSNPYIIDGVPPMPGNKGLKPVTIKIEIDDGIGSVPETIKYCKLIGNGQTVLLRNSGGYIYKGDAQLIRGKNHFTIQAEDLAGNIAIENIDIIIE